MAAPCGHAALRLRAHRRPRGPDHRERDRLLQLYDELGLTPYQVVYEELSSPDGYEPTIRGVLAHLGLADYQGPIPAPQTRRQSNDLNEAWVAAYLADKASRQH